MIAGFSAVLLTWTKAAASACAVRGTPRVSTPAARMNVPKESIDFEIRNMVKFQFFLGVYDRYGKLTVYPVIVQVTTELGRKVGVWTAHIGVVPGSA